MLSEVSLSCCRKNTVNYFTLIIQHIRYKRALYNFEQMETKSIVNKLFNHNYIKWKWEVEKTVRTVFLHLGHALMPLGAHATYHKL